MAAIAPRLALVLAGVVLPAALPAQAPTVSEQISVELVNVDVRVVDRDGRAVTGLTPDVFRVFDDGRPVEVSHFAWVPASGGGQAFAGGAAGSGAVVPRRVALFFDEIQIGERNRLPLLAALRDQLAVGLAADDLVSVVRFDGSNLDVALDWTSDRRRLARALDELGDYSSGQLIAAQELRHWIAMVRSSVTGETGDFCVNTGQWVRGYSDAVKRQVESSAAALLRYAYRLGAQPSPRVLLHVSGGVPMLAGDDVVTWAAEMCDGTALAGGVPGAGAVITDGPASETIRDRWDPKESRLALAEYSNAELWQDVASRVNALGITIYPVLFGENESRFRSELPGGVMTASAAAVARQNSRDTLSFLADVTGGLMIDAVHDTKAQLERLIGDLGGYYSLAFAPAEGRAGVRRIRVEVARDGVELRFRDSYRLQTRGERIALQLADAFAAERFDNPLAVALDIHRPQAGATPRLRIVVPFDRLSMIASPDGGDEGRFTVYVAMRRESGRMLTPRQRSIVARRSDPNALAYTYEIALPDERGDVAIAVVDDYAGTVSLARARMVVR